MRIETLWRYERVGDDTRQIVGNMQEHVRGEPQIPMHSRCIKRIEVLFDVADRRGPPCIFGQETRNELLLKPLLLNSSQPPGGSLLRYPHRQVARDCPINGLKSAGIAHKARSQLLDGQARPYSQARELRLSSLR